MNDMAWLIEHNAGEAQHHFRTYWCAPGDWCCNPSHAFRFPSREVAEKVAGVMKCIQGSFTVSEHQWHTPPEKSHEEAPDVPAASVSSVVAGVPAHLAIALCDRAKFDTSD